MRCSVVWETSILSSCGGLRDKQCAAVSLSFLSLGGFALTISEQRERGGGAVEAQKRQSFLDRGGELSFCLLMLFSPLVGYQPRGFRMCVFAVW